MTACRLRQTIALAGAWLLAAAVLAPRGLPGQDQDDQPPMNPPPMFGGFGGRGRFRRTTPPPELTWEVDPAFKDDVFTFMRARYAYVSPGRGRLWDDDTPDADFNLAFRLHQVTSLKVRPGMNFMDLEKQNLDNYPFIYIAAAGRMELTDEEAKALRDYLLNGGFVMMEDFWGDEQWFHLYDQVKKIFPDREPVPLTLANPIFHTVFDFQRLPQMPSVGTYLNYQLAYDPEYDFDQFGHEPRYFAIYDDHHRMVALICHNNHYGDGWEHEGDDRSYFDLFSEPQAYPMFINILFYVMTH